MEVISRTLLLVEDEAIEAMALSRWFNRAGFKVIHATSGEKAIETVRDNPGTIDIILMDIDLGSGSIDGARAASEILKGNDIPLLFLSSHSEKEIVDRTDQIGSYGYVMKGSEFEVMLASIKMAFKLHEANKQLKLKEAALSESQSRLRRAEFIAKAGNWELDLKTGRMIASEGAIQLYGVKGKIWQLSDIQKTPLPEYRPMLDKALKDLIENDIPYEVEFKIKKADTGEIIDIFSTAKYDKEEKILFGVIRDITEQKRSEEETRQKNKDLAALLRISQALASTVDMKSILQLIVENAASLIGLDSGAIYLHNRDSLYLEATVPPLPEDFPDIFRRTSVSEQPYIAKAFESASVVVIPDTSKVELSPAEETIIKGRNLGSLIYIPIMLEMRTLGILILGTVGQARSYSKSEIDSYSTMSNLAALAIENSKLYQEIAHELAERRFTEEALRKSEESLSVTLKSLGDGVIATDVNGNVTLMNPAAEKMCGYGLDEAREQALQKVFNIINAHTREQVDNPVEAVLKTGKVVGLANHTVLVSRHGQEYQIADSAAPILNESGEKLGVVLVFSDVTEKYQKEEKLHQQEEKYRMLAENVNDIITRHAYDGKLIYVSPSSKRVLGYDPEELIGEYPENYVHPDDSATASIFAPSSVDFKDEYVSAYRTRRKDGSFVWLETSNKVIRDQATGRVEEVICVSREITKRKKVQEELILAKREAEKSDRLKSEFLAQMSHEIRTPINTMLNFISLIKEESPKPLNESLEYSFNAINRSSKRLIRTIDLILNMSQIQSGNFECQFQMLNLGDDILRSIIYENSAAASQKGLELSLCNDYGNAEIFGDEYTVTQIFDNLINNAIKFTESGGIKVRIYSNSDGHFAVDISDTGVGISEEYAQVIFTPFTQEEQGYTRRFEGNGLGLALVKKYCELNLADIKVASRKGSGTTFTVTFIRDSSGQNNGKGK